VTVLRHGAALVLGVVVGLAAVIVHRAAFPLGLLLALVATFATAWWCQRSPRPRTAATFAAGWLAVLLVVLLGRPEGDYAVAADVPGFALLAGGLVLFLVALVVLAGGRRTS
jgi:Family of unknown function (DUF6113)